MLQALSGAEARLYAKLADDAVKRLKRIGKPVSDSGPESASEELIIPNEQEELDVWTCPWCEEAMTAEVRAGTGP